MQMGLIFIRKLLHEDFLLKIATQSNLEMAYFDFADMGNLRFLNDVAHEVIPSSAYLLTSQITQKNKFQLPVTTV